MSFITEIAILLMLAIVFLQSGIDKLVDRKGNLDFMMGHFKQSPLKNVVPLLLSIITLCELAAGLLSAIAVPVLWFQGNTIYAWLGAGLSTLSFLFLLTGQRLAKDYAGAQTIIIYLIPTFFLLYLLSLHAPLQV